jgi:AMMECR1 domain-containing protein
MMDWEIGKHGISLRAGAYSSTFLPEVAGEQGWSKEDTIKHLY